MRIICISGKAQHGKDSTANCLKSSLENDGYKVLIAHYGDLVKYFCHTFFGWDGNKDEVGRTILQQVGTNTVRAKQPNYWVDFLKSVLILFPNEWDYVLIPDCRFPNEVDAMREMFDTKLIRVIRPNFESPLTPEQQAHPSETAMDDYHADFYIKNIGTLSDLQKMTAGLVFEMNGVHQYSFDEL